MTTKKTEYVLPVGPVDRDGRLSSNSWRNFVRWATELADALVLWTLHPRDVVAGWLALEDETHLEVSSYPDPNCRLKGYRVNCNEIDWKNVAKLPTSEETGIAYFSWRRLGDAFAAVQVDDMENFAVFNVQEAEAAPLARACCCGVETPKDLIEGYTLEINDLSESGDWKLLCEAFSETGDGTGAEK